MIVDDGSEDFPTRQPIARLATPQQRTVELAAAAQEALVEAQRAVDAAQARLNALLTGILATEDIRAGTVIEVRGRTLVVELPVNGNGA